MAAKGRLLFVITEDWYFASHRFNLARAARDTGFEVALATRVSVWRERVEAEGIRVFPLRFMRRSSRAPWIEGQAIRELAALYRTWRPDIVHLVAAKPVIYGGIAARISGVTRVVAALAGLGHAFASERATARWLRPLLVAAFRAALQQRSVRLIVQNPEDKRLVIDENLTRSLDVRMISGSGVDTRLFRPRAGAAGPPTFVLVARMLWDKGVGEFVEAARELRQRGIEARFVLVGGADPENPAAITGDQLLQWHREGAVEWWGHRSDMPAVLASAHVACLPSYREGLPKSLLEAAACGLPLVASDVPGCREIAVHEQTGLLVPPRQVGALAAAMGRLCRDPQLRQRLGNAARARVCALFSTEQVVAETLALYEELLAPCASQ
jgi:glycosyltransferase involved in cell wall biosynthesis